jgi:chromosome partitioning protein
MSAIITIAQQKGGAGKTTLAVQLATAMRQAGRSVAMVDIDPQASLTAWMRIRIGPAANRWSAAAVT